MPLFTNHPIRNIRIEPAPEVGAFHDRGMQRTERCGLFITAMWIAFIAFQLIGWR
jgi:hypothetical protein